MVELLYYFICIIVIIIIIFIIYIKLYYHNWCILPVNNLLCLFHPSGIIIQNIKASNKLINNTDIKTYNGNKTSSLFDQKIKKMLKKCSLQGIRLCKQYDIENTSFTSCYHKEKLLFNTNTQQYVDNKEIIGLITSRELKFICDDFKDSGIHFIDQFLWLNDNDNENYNIFFELLETHMINIYTLTNKIIPAIFVSYKKYPLMPLCKIDIYEVRNINRIITKLSKEVYLKIDIIDITDKNFYLLKDFLNKNEEKFDIILKSNISTILGRIQKKELTLKILLVDGLICSFYSFSYIYEYNSSQQQVDKLIYFNGSINNTTFDVFHQGFIFILKKYSLSNNSLYFMDIADNYLLINYYKQFMKEKEEKEEKEEKKEKKDMYYYCYNLKHKTYNSRKLFYL